MHHTPKIGRLLVACAIAAGVAMAPCASHADQSAPPGSSAAEVVSATAIVQKLDKDGRIVTVKGPQGNVFDVKVAPSVDLEKVKVGDRVNVMYYQEVAVDLHKPGEAVPTRTTSTTERGGVTAQQTTVTAKVVSVDAATNTVVLRGPQGGQHSIKVQDPDIQAQLKKIKAGDSVEVTYTQAVAMTLEPTK
jgi:Cu/Ag efflux protein CusF